MQRTGLRQDAVVQWPDPNPDGGAIDGWEAGSQSRRDVAFPIHKSGRKWSILDLASIADVRGPPEVLACVHTSPSNSHVLGVNTGSGAGSHTQRVSCM